MKFRPYLIFLLLFGCKEPYVAPIKYPDTGYLVVEGYINSGAIPPRIKLSRTTKLIDSVGVVNEQNATVSIESDQNEVFPLLYDNTALDYYCSPMTLNSSEKYRLHIITSNGEEYFSDFATVQATPPIDSVSWVRQPGGDVQIYTNTHDPSNTVKYYQWQYDETWEFRSSYPSSLSYTYDPGGVLTGIDYTFANQTTDTTIYKCWKSFSSSSILLGSTEKLSSDLIFLPLRFIPQGSQELSVLYSIRLRQFGISHANYIFLNEMKKNTEQLGSIFDAQPSELQGNIHCITHPSEIVIGFVDVTTEQDQRIYISNNDVPGWNYNAGCSDIIVKNNLDSIRVHADLTPGTPASYSATGIATYDAAPGPCVNCTLSGSNKRPPFWPE